MDDEQTVMEPVLVRVVNAEQEASSMFGSWVKHRFSQLSPRQILPEDAKRKRAVIMVFGLLGDIVYIGSAAQVDNLIVAQASAGEIIIDPGSVSFVSESSSEQWVLPSSTDCVVSVLVERYL